MVRLIGQPCLTSCCWEKSYVQIYSTFLFTHVSPPIPFSSNCRNRHWRHVESSVSALDSLIVFFPVLPEAVFVYSSIMSRR